MRPIGALALAALSIAAGSCDRAGITYVRVITQFDAALVVEQLRFEMSDGATALFAPTLRPAIGSTSLSPGVTLDILVDDGEAAHPLTVKVTGVHAGRDLEWGMAGITPLYHQAANVTVTLDQKVKPDLTLTSIAVAPTNPQVALGSPLALQATGTFSDGSTQDITASAAWSSSDPAVATVGDESGKKGLLTPLKAGLVTITAKRDGVMGTDVVGVTSATLTQLTVAPSHPSLAPGSQIQLFATGLYSDGSSVDLTSSVTWTAADPTIASVGSAPGSKGLVAGLKPGSTTVGAASGTIIASTTVTVTNGILKSMAITPPSATIAKSGTYQFTATGTYSDNTTQDLTMMATWTITPANIATVNAKGLATGLAAGAATLTAAVGPIGGTAQLTVSSATLKTLSITPPSSTLAKGTSLQLSATGGFSDGSSQDLTGRVAWSTSDPKIAAVTSGGAGSGQATGVAAGMVTVSAALGGVTGSASLTVTTAMLKSIAVTPPAASIAKGTTVAFTATGSYSDGSVQDLTQAVAWSSSDDKTATICNANVCRAIASGVARGTATITAATSGVSGMATLTVTDATLANISITPTTPTIAKGGNVQFIATGTYSDNSTQNLTSIATWKSSDLTVVTVSSAGATRGLAGGVSAGKATISATVGTVTGMTDLTVTQATLKSIAVTPANPQVAKGNKLPLKATATYSDLTTQDITSQVSWSSSDNTVASISPGGQAFALAVGMVSVGATQGAVVGMTNLTVTDATLTGIRVAPLNRTLSAGSQLQYTATGTYSDGSTNDVTAQASWSSSNTVAATVSNAAGSQGLVTAAGSGMTSISASAGSFTGMASLTVSNATLMMIMVTPQSAQIQIGNMQSFTATGIYSDMSMQDITNQVTWSSSSTMVATISNAAGSKGLATGVGPGTTTLSAALGKVGMAMLMVTPSTSGTPYCVSIEPGGKAMASGTTFAFKAVAHFMNPPGSTMDVTSSANWTSGDTNIVTVDNANQKGLASAISMGTTGISATVGSLAGMATVCVDDKFCPIGAGCPTNPPPN